MNIGAGIWSLVLGGVLLPGIDSGLDVPGGLRLQEPLPEIDLPGLGSDAGGPGLGPPPGEYRREPGYPSQRPGQGTGAGQGASLPSSPFGETPGAHRPWSPEEPMVPFAPTDPSAGSEAVPWGPPTAGPLPGEAPGQQPTLGGPSASLPSPRLSGTGAYARSRAARPAYRGQSSYGSFASQQAMMSGSGATQGPAFGPTTPISKPYENYTRPGAVSPYMQLGSRISRYGDIDNYNTFVRPALEQREASRQIGRQIQGLQHSVRNLSRETRSLRGVVIPQYYMNHGNYYPGFQR